MEKKKPWLKCHNNIFVIKNKSQFFVFKHLLSTYRIQTSQSPPIVQGYCHPYSETPKTPINILSKLQNIMNLTRVIPSRNLINFLASLFTLNYPIASWLLMISKALESDKPFSQHTFKRKTFRFIWNGGLHKYINNFICWGG